MTGADAPRVLPIAEIAKHDGAVLIEYLDARRYGEDWALYCNEWPGEGVQFVTVGAGKLYLPVEDYDIHWRAWNRRPTQKDKARHWWGRTLG